MSVRVKRLFLALCALILSTSLLSAQNEKATLRGTVLDSTGDPIANVTVVITELSASMDSRQVITDETGNFEAPFLKPGEYKLSIEERGYQSFTADGLVLEPGKVLRYDPKLVAGSAEDTTEAHASPAVIDTQTGTLRQDIDNVVRWSDSPVVDKIPSPFPLMTTAPGVQGTVQGNMPGLVINGISDRNRQVWAMDGIADDTTQGLYVHPLFYEFMEMHLADPGVATYRATGFDLVSKRGIDGVHGQIFYKRGSSNFDAKPFFNAQKNHYTLGEEGGDIGGQIFKGYTYAFGGFVRQTNPYSETLYANVPTAQMRLGNFGQYLNPATSPTGTEVVIRDPRNGVPFPNNQIPSNRIAAVSNSLMNVYYFGPNTGDGSSVVGNYSWTHPFGPDLYKAYWPIIRIDQKLAAQNTLYGRWIDTVNSSVLPGSIGESFDSTQSRQYRSLMISDTHVFAPSVVNQVSFNRITDYVKQGETEAVTPVHGDAVISATGLQGLNINGYSVMGTPTISINGFTGISMALAGGYSNNAAQNDSIYTLQDSVAWSKGRHAVKVGALYTRMNWLLGTVPQLNYGAFNFTGTFTGIGFADFLLGYPATSSRILQPRINDKMNQSVTGAFITDSFRVSSRLTVDYGARWDYFLSPVYNDGYMYNWDPSTGTIIVAPGTITSVSTLLPKNIRVVSGGTTPRSKTTNIRPRVSAAYRLSDNLVLRGGYGEFTDGGGYGPYGGRINDPNGPYRLAETYINSNVNGIVTYAFPKPFPAAPSASLTPTPSVTALPNHTDEGVTRQYNLTLERAVRGIALRASYIGSRGTGLNYTLDVNKPRASTTPFATSRLPYPQFGSTFVTRTDGQWHYDSAQVQAQKRLGSVMFDTSFTLANNVSNYLNTYDPYNVTNHWSRDAADRRRYFVASAIWALPVGKGKRFLTDPRPFVQFFLGNWSLQAITTFASGQYYTPLFNGLDPANASQGIVTTLPDCVGDPNAGAKTLNRWFNPAAFAIPPANAGRYGTCGVNILEGYPIHVVHGSLAKRIPVGEAISVYLTAQVSNVTNSPHFTFPNNNLSTPAAGAFTAVSVVPDIFPERQGARQLDLKIRVQW